MLKRIADRLFRAEIHAAATEYALSIFHVPLPDHNVHIESHRAVFSSISCSPNTGLHQLTGEVPASG